MSRTPAVDVYPDIEVAVDRAHLQPVRVAFAYDGAGRQGTKRRYHYQTAQQTKKLIEDLKQALVLLAPLFKHDVIQISRVEVPQAQPLPPVVNEAPVRRAHAKMDRRTTRYKKSLKAIEKATAAQPHRKLPAKPDKPRKLLDRPATDIRAKRRHYAEAPAQE